ncbi:LysM peptidoglycan-binding domain-containing protein [Pseudomonas sp.]|uniref:LysM peptidoglycan-binding domain-containing protein n=1 Tax=Pseudomonas sp. TaxID=306 RepID=UPI003561FA71
MDYLVKAGDTLSMIARSHNTTVATLMRLNPQIENADRITPKQVIRLPGEQTQQRQTRNVGQVADCSECADKYVDLVHQANEMLFIPLTAEMQRAFQQEEARLEQLIAQFYTGLQGTAEAVREHKSAFIALLEEERVIDEAKPSEPFRLTEIRRLKGNKHYNYVRRDDFWQPVKRQRSYSIKSQDEASRQGWFDPSSGKLDTKKMLGAIADDLKSPELKASWTIYEDFADWCLLEWQGNLASWKPIEGMEPITVDVEAQALRFAIGASMSAGYDPLERSAHIAAQASTSASLVEAKGTVSTTWPAEGQSEWKIIYLDDAGQAQESSLGKFRAKVELEITGFAGASALLTADVQIDMKNGIPRLKGVGGEKYQKAGEGPAKLAASAFAGVRADGKLEGSIEWQDTLASKPEWNAICTIGVGVGAALGLGLDAQILLKWSPQTGKFYFNVHAGLVAGAGASGELGAEVDVGEFVTMLHCVYNALLEVDFRRVKSIDVGAFAQLCDFALYSLLTGSPIRVAATELGSQALDKVGESIKIIFRRHQTSHARESLAIQAAEHVLRDALLGQTSWLRHAPPEVKGRLLDTICYDYGVTPWDYYTLGANSREQAILTLLESSQSWRDYEETVTRMNPEGTKGNFEANRQRLRDFMRLYQGHQLEPIEIRLKPAQPVANQPVRIARHIELSGIRYA